MAIQLLICDITLYATFAIQQRIANLGWNKNFPIDREYSRSISNNNYDLFLSYISTYLQPVLKFEFAAAWIPELGFKNLNINQREIRVPSRISSRSNRGEGSYILSLSLSLSIFSLSLSSSVKLDNKRKKLKRMRII